MFLLAAYWFPSRHTTISRIVSSIRKVSKNETSKAEYQHWPQSTLHGHIKLDTHADTTVLGSNCVVLYTGKECVVSPYSSQYEAVRNVPVVTGATVWTNAMDGTAYLLIFHESLWMGDKLDHTLVNPISSGLTVSASRTTLSTPSPSLLPPMMPLLNCIRRGRSSAGTLGHQQNPSWADSHGSSLYPRMTGIPIMSVSRRAVVSHLTTYQSSLIT